MNRTATVFGSSVVLALVIGIASSGAIVEAAKPLTEMIIANDNTRPIPVTVENFPTSSSEVTIVNSEPIEVTGISTSTVCPTDKIQHWYTLYIENTLSFIELRSPTKPTLFDNESYWMNINVDSDYIYKPNQLVIDKLNELGYVAYNINTDTSSPLSYADTWIVTQNPLAIQSSHSTICANS